LAVGGGEMQFCSNEFPRPGSSDEKYLPQQLALPPNQVADPFQLPHWQADLNE